MPNCTLRYCKNYSQRTKKSSEGITFHKFPRPGHGKREQWIKYVQNDRREESWLPSEHRCICSEHFREQDFYLTKTGRRYLKKYAVPVENPKDSKEDLDTSPTSLTHVDVSDSESIFDTPSLIQLKKDLSNTIASNNVFKEKNIKLRRQCRYLTLKNQKLSDIMKKHKSNFPLECLLENENQLVQKASVVKTFHINITNALNDNMSSEKPVTNKLINSPETCVDDNLLGLVTTYPLLHLHPKHRVVTVRPTKITAKVAVIGGGGSGHEPFAAGFVGAGMLDGAVAGGIFASPPTGNVLYAITHLYKYNEGGVLVIIGNYTGDRLNFGKAIEKAKIAGAKVEGVIIGEDVASSHNKTGGRGMIGEVFLYKMCGALASKGADLKDVQNLAIESKKYMATLGVCLSPCSLPGQPPLFEIAYGMMELGAGVHGEAGISKEKLGTAKEVVGLILGKIVEHLKIAPEERVAAMINNLGGTSILEMNIISKEIKEYLETRKITVERIYSGHKKSSLEMHGFQICLLHLTKQQGDSWLELLDAPTNAPCWSGSEASFRREGGVGDDDTLLQADGRKTASGPSLTAKQQELFHNSLKIAAEELVKNESLLNRLDSGCGDGDCGNTLKRFALAVLAYLKTASLEYPSNVLWDLSEIAETDMGGSSGGIYSLGLSAASQAFASAKSVEPVVWLSAWRSAMQAISKYGGAEPGDRTMLDTLHTAAVAFEDNLKSDLKTLVLKTAEAADQGSKATATMIARAGRASYVSSEYLTDEDAGARAAAVWLQAIFSSIANTI